MAADNFLVPNATFIVELIIFAIILVLLGRYVLPRISGAIAERQAAITKEFAEAEEAKAKAEAPDRKSVV